MNDDKKGVLTITLSGVILGASLALGLPWLWAVLKPLLHAITG